jgi:hypothetical protein
MPRTVTIFNNVDASVNQISQQFDFDFQDARFLIQILGTGLDASPKIIIEESTDGNLWTAMESTETWDDYFPAGNQIMGIKDNYFMGQYMRLKIEPNGNTTGTIKAVMCYKTRV